MVIEAMSPECVRAYVDQLPFTNDVAGHGRKPHVTSGLNSMRTRPRLEAAIRSFDHKKWLPNPSVRLHAFDQFLERHRAVNCMQRSDVVGIDLSVTRSFSFRIHGGR
jgi:hypothetical protein